MTDPAAIALAASGVGFLINSGVLSWGIWSFRKIAKEEADAVAKQIAAQLNAHDRDPQAHPNHHMTPVIQTLQLQITQTLTELKGDVKGLQREIEALRRAHDDAVARGSCLYQQDTPGKDR